MPVNWTNPQLPSEVTPQTNYTPINFTRNVGFRFLFDFQNSKRFRFTAEFIEVIAIWSDIFFSIFERFKNDDIFVEYVLKNVLRRELKFGIILF